MIRPSKSELTQRAGVTAAIQPGGYCWFFLERGDLSKDRYGERRAAWAEDGGHHYFTCPFCKAINEAHTDGTLPVHGHGVRTVPELSFVHNGRDLDSHSCEVCGKCEAHMWVTFVGAVPRRIWGALKRDKTKCPQCKKVVKGSSHGDATFGRNRTVPITTYGCCGMRWR